MITTAGALYVPGTGRPVPSSARFWSLLASLLGYALVGWCVLGLVTAVVGDPVTIYLQSTHNNAVLAVSSTFRHESVRVPGAVRLATF